MDNLRPNLLAVHHSRAFRDPKKAHPGQVELIVGINNSGEMIITQEQRIGIQKISKQNACYLLAISSFEQKRQQATGIPKN